MRPRTSQELVESIARLKSTLAFHDAFSEETLEYLNFVAFSAKMTRFQKRMEDNNKYKR